MTEAQTILEMIESVDMEHDSAGIPYGAEILDQIDARVWCWVHEYQFREYPVDMAYPYKGVRYTGKAGEKKTEVLSNKKKYSRSRDALKAIRPDYPKAPNQMYWEMGNNSSGVWYTCHCTRGVTIQGDVLPTEELAELQVIIKVIEWMRRNDEAG